MYPSNPISRIHLSKTILQVKIPCFLVQMCWYSNSSTVGPSVELKTFFASQYLRSRHPTSMIVWVCPKNTHIHPQTSLTNHFHHFNGHFGLSTLSHTPMIVHSLWASTVAMENTILICFSLQSRFQHHSTWIGDIVGYVLYRVFSMVNGWRSIPVPILDLQRHAAHPHARGGSGATKAQNLGFVEIQNRVTGYDIIDPYA
jgi:hypothetical protein